MFRFIKKRFIRLLRVYAIGSFGASLVYNYEQPIKYVSLNNQPCQARPTIVNKTSHETLFIHLLSVLISVMEVVTLLMIHTLNGK